MLFSHDYRFPRFEGGSLVSARASPTLSYPRTSEQFARLYGDINIATSAMCIALRASLKLPQQVSTSNNRCSLP